MSNDEFGALVERAHQHVASAEALLGIAYMEGVRVPHDDAEAVRWLTKASQQGQPVAQKTLDCIHAFMAAVCGREDQGRKP